MNYCHTIVYSIFFTIIIIGFVTWPPFLYQDNYIGGQVTANCEKYAINYCMSFKEFKKFFDKVTSWPQLISKLLVAPTCLHVASDWPRTSLHPRCFCLAFEYPTLPPHNSDPQANQKYFCEYLSLTESDIAIRLFNQSLKLGEVLVIILLVSRVLMVNRFSKI